MQVSFLFGQSLFTAEADSVQAEMKTYMKLIAKADIYEQKADLELSKTTFYKTEARKLLDSAYIIAKKGEFDKKNYQLYIMQFNMVFGLAEKYTKDADSSLAKANRYKDTALIKNKEAEAYYLLIAENYKPIVDGDTLESVIYVIQLGAGNMVEDYFEKINEVKIITPKDGIRRYIVGEFRSKEAAIEYRNKLVELGYLDAFIRTYDSLR